MRKITAWTLLAALALAAGCARLPGVFPTPAPAATPAPGGAQDMAAAQAAPQPARQIPLAGPAAVAKAELSGLAWYSEDTLVLLPQYPRRFKGGPNGALFALQKADILAFLDGRSDGPLTPRAVPLSDNDIDHKVKGFEGFEAVAFEGDTVYLTIESRPGPGMMGYLIKGRVVGDLESVVLDDTTLAPIPPQADRPNFTDEALLAAGADLYTFYEANGSGLNPNPVAHHFSTDLQPLPAVPFAHVPYRITDATALDADQRFWVINFFFLGDIDLAGDADPLDGPRSLGLPLRFESVERLVELQKTETGFALSGTPPINLGVTVNTVRNWEGIARLDARGFLLATDKYPSTVLAFVPNPY